MCKCVFWACPVHCTSLYNDIGLHLPHTRSTPCPSCDNQACLRTLTKVPPPSKRMKISIVRKRIGDRLEKNLGANVSEDIVQHSKYKGKYSCHSGWTFWPVWRDPIWTRMFITCESRCFDFKYLCSFGKRQWFWSFRSLVALQYYEVWRLGNHSVVGIGLLTKAVYVGLALRSL